jgi:hypothetical protein
MQNVTIAALSLILALGACSGNPLATGATPELPDPGTMTPDSPVVVPDALKFNLQSARLVPGVGGNADTLLIAISALDTTPIDATWQRRPNLDVDGFAAFAVQEDSLDRLFIGLTGTSADGSTTAYLAGDGGQFNKYFSGTLYARDGGYTPPDASQSGPAKGLVSYSGKYVGLLNGGGIRSETLIIPRPASSSQRPSQASRVEGDVFVNADFANNSINGDVTNRVALDLNITDDPTSANYNAGTGVALEDVVLVAGDQAGGDILANGTFTGITERPGAIDPKKEATGTYGGVIGGVNGSSIAGGLHLQDNKVINSAGDAIVGAIERGIFVLDQCGLTTSGGACVGTAP